MELKFRLIFDELVMYDVDPRKGYYVLSPKGRSIEAKKVKGVRFTPPMFEPNAKFFMAMARACKIKGNREAYIVVDDCSNKVGVYFTTVKKGVKYD